MVAWHTHNGSIALLDGVRTPFVKAGTALRKVSLTDLSRVTMQEVLHRVGCPADTLDEVILGNVVMPADAANPARVAATQAGAPTHVPALTVQRNCASGIEAITEGVARIDSGHARLVLAAGAESMSNIPLLLPRETFEPMTRLFKAKTWWQKISALATFRPRHFKPESAIMQGLTDPLCGMIMGDTAELLAQEFGISRAEQDAFALRSHQRASAAIEAGYFDDQIVPIYAGDRFEPVTADVGPRKNQSREALAKLRPMFDRRDGTVTVGNACQVTDGAVSLLIADSELAHGAGYSVLGHVRAYATVALEPARMGLGPVYAIDQILQMTGYNLKDIDLFEINEAFAAQVLACIKAMGSDRFCLERLGRSNAMGDLDLERLNVDGGAIALGHPVGASGTRIVLTLLRAMHRRGARLGIASLCAGGGQGAAILVERNGT